ncbi:GNAT family N-acetyltransferase [Leptothoe kymatousa]|uniref:GNAT family N-acetyltransferase n=1 Tax=Leptothoe kymatousa TAU-MAC 1615 TaxID=2364775 RepID=A0ABS5XZI4_9CYAN|nr:GNAT family N-acetyltransferase [Leptothoe kymatousa]MBT9311012.1 GNAT family N-acetyltransferase [Leptothoe kymatousa TAU-MAC 1615]
MITFQRLNAGDVERLRQIRLLALKDAPDAFSTTFQDAFVWPRDSWVRQLQKLPTFVAVVDGADSGMVRGALHSEKINEAYLLSLWVAPHARGQGVGQGLINAVIDWMRSEGCQRLVLDVGEHNAGVIALYQRMGFKPTGITKPMPPPREHILEFEMALEL